jgi:hypothetical protein
MFKHIVFNPEFALVSVGAALMAYFLLLYVSV